MRILILILITVYLVEGKGEYDWGKVEEVVNNYLMDGAYKGGILRVSNGTDTIYNYPFGHLTNN